MNEKMKGYSKDGPKPKGPAKGLSPSHRVAAATRYSSLTQLSFPTENKAENSLAIY